MQYYIPEFKPRKTARARLLVCLVQKSEIFFVRKFDVSSCERPTFVKGSLKILWAVLVLFSSPGTRRGSGSRRQRLQFVAGNIIKFECSRSRIIILYFIYHTAATRQSFLLPRPGNNIDTHTLTYFVFPSSRNSKSNFCLLFLLLLFHRINGFYESCLPNSPNTTRRAAK